MMQIHKVDNGKRLDRIDVQEADSLLENPKNYLLTLHKPRKIPLFGTKRGVKR